MYSEQSSNLTYRQDNPHNKDVNAQRLIVLNYIANALQREKFATQPAFVFLAETLNKILKKFIKLNNWSTLDIRIIFMGYQLRYQAEDVHAKNHNVEKNIVNVTALGLNVQMIVNVAIAIMVNLKWIIIMELGECKFKFTHEYVMIFLVF
jgi:hypothetical protein